ncbi:MAG: hypothetical protein WAM82_34790 [Thermoanaerobaculia bacterium]
MKLPSPRIVVVDDDLDDIRAIVDGLAHLGTTAFGLHYSMERSDQPQFPCLRILFLDLHLMGSGGNTEQQVKNTLGVLANLLTPDNGPYAIVVWSGHVGEGLDRFQLEIEQRLPKEGRPLPLKIIPLDKVAFIRPSEGERRVDKPDELKRAIMDRIQDCPQLAALLSWEEDVAGAADDAIRQVFQIARQTASAGQSQSLAAEVNRILAEIAVAAIGFHNAEADAFRGVNEVLVQVVADRLQRRSASPETVQLWQQAVTDFKKKSDLRDEDASLLNRFLHVDVNQVQPWERGSITSLEVLPEEKFRRLWSETRGDLLQEFCLPSEAQVEWVMLQVQPACDQAQRNRGLLPYMLGLRVNQLSKSKRDEIRRKECLWLSPILGEGAENFFLVFHLRFVTGLSRKEEEFPQLACRYRLREQILAEISHDLHTHGGRPGIIRFSR